MSGRYVVFEGGEGSGKSTQARRLAERLGALLTKEPGATEIGVRIRELLLDPASGEIDDRTEALLMLADRAQHLADVVVPTLVTGRDVVSDRSSYSTLAYQGHGRGLSLNDLRGLCDWACAGLWPDLVILLDLPVEVGFSRLGEPDRMEQAGAEFHERVRAGYLQLARDEPQRWVVVDADASPDEVEQRILAEVVDRIG